MKKFVIHYVMQAMFGGQGFYHHTHEVWGAVNALGMLKDLRGMKISPVAIWVTCE